MFSTFTNRHRSFIHFVQFKNLNIILPVYVVKEHAVYCLYIALCSLNYLYNVANMTRFFCVASICKFVVISH